MSPAVQLSCRSPICRYQIRLGVLGAATIYVLYCRLLPLHAKASFSAFYYVLRTSCPTLQHILPPLSSTRPTGEIQHLQHISDVSAPVLAVLTRQEEGNTALRSTPSLSVIVRGTSLIDYRLIYVHHHLFLLIPVLVSQDDVGMQPNRRAAA